MKRSWPADLFRLRENHDDSIISLIYCNEEILRRNIAGIETLNTNLDAVF